MNNNLAPIVLFVYNRPWHTRQTVEALQKNELANKSELFIYSDGPKNEEAKKSVKEVREYIQSIDGFKKITIVERDQNLGLANSIIDGVTKIVNRYGKIIVLEDDLVTSPYFLRFMNEALERYRDEDRVWHISGYIQPFEKNFPKEHFFLKPTTCWGWATWADRWRHINKDTNYFLDKFDKKSIYDFNIKNSYPYHSHIVMNANDEIDTWAIFWYATVYFNDGLSLHPFTSYVDNIGHDGSGVHCRANQHLQTQIEKNDTKYIFSTKIELHKQANRSLVRYYKQLKKSLLRRVLDKIYMKIKKEN